KTFHSSNCWLNDSGGNTECAASYVRDQIIEENGKIKCEEQSEMAEKNRSPEQQGQYQNGKQWYRSRRSNRRQCAMRQAKARTGLAPVFAAQHSNSYGLAAAWGHDARGSRRASDG